MSTQQELNQIGQTPHADIVDQHHVGVAGVDICPPLKVQRILCPTAAGAAESGQSVRLQHMCVMPFGEQASKHGAAQVDNAQQQNKATQMHQQQRHCLATNSVGYM